MRFEWHDKANKQRWHCLEYKVTNLGHVILCKIRKGDQGAAQNRRQSQCHGTKIVEGSAVQNQEGHNAGTFEHENPQNQNYPAQVVEGGDD